ncbi:outer mitochondrial transmembrane helix translocase-like isoform X1 [Anopheles coustani]|uniref:outer mitochondrial transmembrane helix translocase-like isoform X1 n=1 Tax=Anopheles coustani TaxID=139045 RepID=UPI0026589ADB|nr:outer mitochondrial transmembrane helix translocase-like isoform X1 [Anopheles coustani]
MSGVNVSRNEVVQFVLRISLLSIVTYYSAKWLIRNLDPSNKTKKKAIEHAEDILKKLSPTLKKSAVQNLNEYEMVIASHLIVPENISESWDSIAGLDHVCEEIKESLVFPVCHRDMFAGSALYQPPKGVLLYGPPGCGKTLIAKATAKEAGMRFINLDVAMLTDKWYGESQKLASAVFSLAVKIQPCIIFIDEIDSFLRARNSSDHEATAMMKTQFMMLWDGLNTESDSTVIVMGATNRPQDLDKAILRRMPAQFHIGLPSEEQRQKILQLVLQKERLSPEIDFAQLARLTNGFSGSDLKEICRNASVHRVRKVMKSKEMIAAVQAAANKAHANGTAEGSSKTMANGNGVLPGVSQTFQEMGTPAITMEDLTESLRGMKHSKYTTGVVSDARIDLD